MTVHRGPRGLHRLLAALGEPTRRRTYDLLCRADRPLSRADVAAELGIGVRLAAFHLDKLLAEGLASAHYARPPRTGRRTRRRAPRQAVRRQRRALRRHPPTPPLRHRSPHPPRDPARHRPGTPPRGRPPLRHLHRPPARRAATRRASCRTGLRTPRRTRRRDQPGELPLPRACRRSTRGDLPDEPRVPPRHHRQRPPLSYRRAGPIPRPVLRPPASGRPKRTTVEVATSPPTHAMP
jgi:DNA-binding transcriptional ArsR family regulator